MESPKPAEILSSTLVAIVRHFISIIAAYLISKGLIAPDVLSETNIGILAAGSGAALISVGWIVFNKLKTHRLVEAARLASANENIANIKRDAAQMPLLGK